MNSDMAYPNAVVRYRAGSTFSSGSVKCIDILDNENGVTKPSVCGSIQAETHSRDNPCGCNSGGGPCEASYVGSDACDICQGLRVGDPSRFIGDSGYLPGLTCAQLDAISDNAFDSNTCPKIQADAAEFCQCTDGSVTPCVATDLGPEKSNCTASDVCCDGVCQFRGTGIGLVCSTRYALPKDQWPDWALEKVPYPERKNNHEGTKYEGNSGMKGDAIGIVSSSDSKTGSSLWFLVMGALFYAQ